MKCYWFKDRLIASWPPHKLKQERLDCFGLLPSQRRVGPSLRGSERTETIQKIILFMRDMMQKPLLEHLIELQQ